MSLHTVAEQLHTNIYSTRMYMYNFDYSTKKCIHLDARCDLHPHPACIYKNNTTGEMVAEDEEHCNEEYVNKGLVPRTVNMQCNSPIHNMDSPAMKNYKYNFTKLLMDYQPRNWLFQLQVIPKETIVHTLATKCDGHKECWKGLDEVYCDDLDPGVTVLIGTYFKSSVLAAKQHCQFSGKQARLVLLSK